MKHAIISILLAFGFTTCWAQASTNSAVTDAKSAAAVAAKLMQNKGYELNADGSVKLDASGNPIATKAWGPQSQLDYVKSVMGIQGVENVAEPGRGMRAGANVSVENKVLVSCAATSGSQFSTAGVAFVFQSCSVGSTGEVRSLQLRACANGLQGGACARDSDFSDTITLQNGSYSTSNGVRYGLGCNAAGQCYVQVRASTGVAGSAEDITKAAAARVQNSGDSDYSTGLKSLVLDASKGYAKKLEDTASDVYSCYERSRLSVERGGPPIRCDGEALAALDSTPVSNGAQCSAAPVCLQEATVQNAPVTRSCVRSFPLTTKVSRTEFTRTLTCEEQGGANSCDRPSNAPENWSDPRKGMTLVGDEQVCVQGDAQACQAQARRFYYVDERPEAVQALSVEASPSPLSAERPQCESPLVTTCEGEWFGRVLSGDECTAQVDIDPSVPGDIDVIPLDFRAKAGCGVCLKPVASATCYGEPSEDNPADTCATSELAGCSLVETRNAATTQDGNAGLVISQEEVYSCRNESKVCVQYAAAPAGCNGTQAKTFGLDTPTANKDTTSGSFGNAIAQSAVLNGIAKGLQESNDVNFPKIFNGEALVCSRPTGGLGTILSKNCCRTDLQRPKKGNLIQRGCSEKEVKLAAARRANVTVFIEEWCSKKLSFPSRCLRRSELYCAFQGTLARIVQLQGRAQLARIAASGLGASLSKKQVSFGYYSESDEGGWTAPEDINGVKAAMWQFPKYCRTPEAMAARFAAVPDSLECPSSLELWVAACDNPAGCGALPSSPADGALGWALQAVNPLKNVTTAVSRYSVVTGSCNPNTEQCTYEVAAWPAGQGGKVTVSRDVAFPLYTNQLPTDSIAITPNLGNAADLMYRAYSLPGSATSLPAAVRIDFSTDGGQTWATHQVPTTLGASEYSVTGTDIKITGACQLESNVCEYRMTGTTTVTQKPWGNRRNVDCSGFTPGQIGALDFGQMDLSEWINEVMTKSQIANLATGEGRANAVELIKAQVRQQASTPTDQTATTVASGLRPGSSPVAIATPSEGYGPFTATLRVTGRYPYKPEEPDSGDLVTQVDVNWGDCSPVEQLPGITSVNGLPAHGFEGKHKYQAPNADQHYSCGVGREDSVTHKVTVKLYTRQGVYTHTLNIINAWNAVGGNSNGNLAATTQESKKTLGK